MKIIPRHFKFFRDFGCVIGLANVKGLCKKSGNTGFTKTQLVNKVKLRSCYKMKYRTGLPTQTEKNPLKTPDFSKKKN
jgi:hypothetical protein